MDILTQIQTLQPNAKVDVVNLLIEKVKAEVVLYCRTDYIPAMDNVIVDIILFKLNQLGNEGIASVGANGISESYLTDYPSYIKQQLYSFRKNVIFK